LIPVKKNRFFFSPAIFLLQCDIDGVIPRDWCWVVPSPNNPLGAKGAGEVGTAGAAPTRMNAVLNALRTVGFTHFDTPAMPSRIWSAIAAAKAASQ
jgi:hypothetical protein